MARRVVREWRYSCASRGGVAIVVVAVVVAAIVTALAVHSDGGFNGPKVLTREGRFFGGALFPRCTRLAEKTQKPALVTY